MFDEAHLLFDDAPEALLDRIEQVVRIIRSKGVGVYFCSQFPDDVPGEILGQLGTVFSTRFGRLRRAIKGRADGSRNLRGKPEARRRAGDFHARRGRGARLDTARQRCADARATDVHGAAARAIGAITADERAAVRLRSPIGTK